MVRISITFTEDLICTPKAVQTFRFRINDYYGIYDRVMQYTGNHDLAESVANFAELNPVGDEYECDELKAVIRDE